MCGFAGEIRTDGPADVGAVAAMGATLADRGPDGDGLWASGGVAMAHRRLQIIDLSDRGAQPFVDQHLEVALVFNGCIYNHHELRRELRAAGYEFQSTSDTEVIAKAYRHWGDRCVEHFRGMFAFVLVERGEGPGRGRVLMARDRLGVKPLYLAEVDGALRFASTLPALLAGGGVDTSLDPVALHNYFSWHAVVPPPRTVYCGVRKLKPATRVTIEPDGTRREKRYWRPDYVRRGQDVDMTPQEWRDELLEKLDAAIQWRMVADVPVGVLLSGGVDSSLIVALLDRAGQKGLATYSIGFESGGGREGDEFAYSDLIAERYGTDHHRWRVGAREIADALPHAIAAMNEPMVSHDTVAFYLLSQEVKKTRKVVQCGQGADEVLAGYSWYPPLAQAEGLGDDVYAANFFDRDHEEIVATLAPGMVSGDDVSREFVRTHFQRATAQTPLDRALRLDTEVMLVDDPVQRVDSMTMAWGLEARTPFLDHELIELAAACPPELKLAGGGKGLLKEAARGLLPDEVIDRKKGYFPVPLLSHLEGPALELVQDVMSSDAARSRGIYRDGYVDQLLADPTGHKTRLDGSKLWQIASLELWLQTHPG